MSKQVTSEQREYLFQIYTHKFLGCDLGKLRKEFDLIMKYDNKYRPYWFAKIVKNINK